ncbi:hypothetical protein D3C84_249620 [compost metagenome]
MVQQQCLQPVTEAPIRQPLGQAQYHPLIPVAGLGEALLEEPVLDGVQREFPLEQPRLRLVTCGLLLAELAAEAAHRLGLEHVLDAAMQPRIPQPGAELDAEDGVAAQAEEVILHPERLLEHPLPDGEHRLLQLALWLALALLPLEGGQAAQIQLAVGGERHLGQPAQSHRHHIFRQQFTGPL